MLIGLSALTILSCSEESLTGNQQEQPLSQSGSAMTSAQMQTQAKQMAQSPSPQEVSKAFFVMMDKAAAMSAAEIDSLSEQEILELGKPILDATAGTITLAKTTLDKLNDVLQPLGDNIRNVSQKEHQAAGDQIKQIMASEATKRTRSMESSQVRQILLKFQGEATRSSSTCEDLYDQWGGYVHLYSGDNLNIANSICPAGSMFWVHGGNYNSQKVENSKDGNFWLGVNGTVTLDGQGSTTAAFTGGMANNYFSWMEIQNYTERGIFSTSSSSNNIEFNNMTFKNIAGNKDGSVFFGAIYFRNASNILIENSYFNNVSQSVRFRESTGPLQVLNNEALNTVFGFFQCIECEGSNIKINYNSLEHSSQYGPKKLVDFINIFKSNGLNTSNRIQVNNNRARINLVNGSASGVTDTGCFIILGDIGGVHQEAKNNIGVNPGNCGIGVAGGSQFKVENNKIFSQRINGISNVGIYAAAFPSDVPCNHPPNTFSNNRSSYICGQHPIYGNKDTCGLGSNNFAYATLNSTHDNYCGIILDDIRDPLQVQKDTTLTAAIWNEW